jgi:predicted secreted protein
MFRKCMLIVLLFAVFVADGFCCGNDLKKEMIEKNTVTVKEQDSGKLIRVQHGDLIRVELAAMGGAGYNWYIDNLNTDYLELLSEETTNAPGEEIGGPVTRAWIFRAKKEGKAEIKMDHYRIWEGKEKAIGHFSVKLSVE